MASVCKDSGGTRRILFVAPDGSRKTIRLGKVDQRSAEQVARHVEALLAARIAGTPVPRETAVWLADLADVLHQRLARAGLTISRQEASRTLLGPMCDAYLARKTDIKPASLLAVQQVVRNLKTYFGESRDINTITPGDAEDFARWVKTDGRTQRQRARRGPGLSPATIGKRLRRSASIFTDAVKRRLIPGNPFDGLKTPPATNSERQAYIPAADVERIIDATPDAEWKLLLALSRYVGVRVPSEPFSLTWDAVDWERSRIRLPSPKTAVHGKAYRVVPILPEVRPHLEAVFDAAPAGTVYVFARLRERPSVKEAERGFWRAVNLRQHLLRLIVRAALKPWPRLWHNLRASAQTDLASHFPAHVVCEWLGNSRAVAADHYLQVTDQHFETAVNNPVNKAAQNPAQYLHASCRTYTQQEFTDPPKTLGNSTPCNLVRVPAKGGDCPARI